MTHRDDQIAAAAAALDSELDDRSVWLGDVLTIAASVVDAVLPQVSTVDELVALPHRTVLVSADGQVMPWSSRIPEINRLVAESMLGSCPLTIVWQP